MGLCVSRRVRESTPRLKSRKRFALPTINKQLNRKYQLTLDGWLVIGQSRHEIYLRFATCPLEEYREYLKTGRVVSEEDTMDMLNLMYSTARQFAYLGSVLRIARISSGLAIHLGPVIFAISPIVLAFLSPLRWD